MCCAHSRWSPLTAPVIGRALHSKLKDANKRGLDCEVAHDPEGRAWAAELWASVRPVEHKRTG